MKPQAKHTNAPTVDRRSVADQVYAGLMAEILSGRIALGARVVESQIALNYQTSRAPVREAVQRLTQEGLLEARAHFGPSVISLSPERIEDLYEARLAIEARAIEALCRKKKPEAISALESHIEAMRAASAEGDFERLVDSELAFHMALCEFSGNSYLINISQTLQDQTRLALAVDNALYAQMLDVAEEHVQLVAAIREGDGAKAVKELERHIMSSLAAMR